LFEEVATWLNKTGKFETCMREVMERVLGATEAYQQNTLPRQLQHSIRGALNAAGFESTGKQFTSGDYKGHTIFARVQEPPF
jgi:hypothetical protein